MTIRKVANPGDRAIARHEEVISLLTNLENLVAVRKSLTGSKLSVIDLDQIIAKKIENLQILGELDGSPATLLKKLDETRTHMMAYGADLAGVEALIEKTIAGACSSMAIERTVRDIIYGTKGSSLSVFNAGASGIELLS
ncbi:MAG: hypothetical protein L6R40_008560 [Gallowayella cf. fulva]|nr:MAG: hypothetical protein L6R40_008560 [Xanthomendoza cf. fulva]